MNPAGLWWAAVPKDEWPEDETAIADINSKLIGPYGDRHQELVFIGHEMDHVRVTGALDNCLLTDSEFELGPSSWRGFEDPFPPIELSFEDDESLETWR